MRSFSIPGRRAGRIATTAALLVATIVPSFAPALASAAQITQRSIALSSSVVNESGVSYLVTFTAENTAAAAAVEFCSNSPLFGDSCTAPTGFDAATSGNVTGGTKSGTWTANRAFVTKAISAGVNTFTITGVHNPSTAGTVYARIATYDTAPNAAAYPATTGRVDNGSVALAVTNGVSVSGAVLETLTFCVSGATIANADCSGTTAPVLTLGTLDAGTGLTSLNSGSVSTGNVYTKLSTNASSGAVVTLKSMATCGGLAFNGNNSVCHIAAAGTSGTIGDGDPKFGVRLTLPTTNDNSDNNGVILANSNYDTTNYHFNYSQANPNTAGVTSTYGDPIYNTTGYVNNKDTTLTFGASAAPNTPAGKYSTSITLIATGTF